MVVSFVIVQLFVALTHLITPFKVAGKLGIPMTCLYMFTHCEFRSGLSAVRTLCYFAFGKCVRVGGTGVFRPEVVTVKILGTVLAARYKLTIMHLFHVLLVI